MRHPLLPQWLRTPMPSLSGLLKTLPHAASRATLVLGALALLSPWAAHAQSVALTGVLGSKALLVINGGAPKALAAQESSQGVQVVSVAQDSVVVRIEGKTQTVRLGEAPVSVGGGSGPANGSKVVLTADSRGHFNGSGQINGMAMQFMVDTGASAVAISKADADRMGLKYQDAPRVGLNTANGQATGWLVKLDRVRVGDVTVYGVEAVISPQPMPFVLLGNSFLNSFQMTRRGSQMVLEKH